MNELADSVETTGKTVQEAIALALEQLGADEDAVDIEVLDEAAKGIFGIISGRTARIRATIRHTAALKASEFLGGILKYMNSGYEIEAREDEESVVLNISGNDGGIIIGKHGETLDALQYLTSLVVNRDRDGYKRVTVDIENYREKREEALVNLANRLAGKVIAYKKPVSLEPMNPHERRIIHCSLQDNKYVKTYSTGDEPNRRVIIALK
jgi:spoIIIJ-associated protein